MPINNITQTISTISPPPHRGVDVQTVFVNKQEDFQDHLADITIDELNTLKDQLNTRIGEINSTATTMNGYADTASAGASTATTKAGEASASATAALTSKNQASTFATNSSNSATKADQWADNNYNVEVETGKYSAKHWATVAQSSAIEDTKGINIASASTITIGTAGLGDYIHITGTTTISSLGTTTSAGTKRTLIFDNALTLTHNATSLICPKGVSVNIVAGTVIEVIAETASNWRVVSITHPSVSFTELGYLGGVSSNIQTQLNNKFTKTSATETASGIIEIATTAETQAGTDDLSAITPLKLFNSLKGSNQNLSTSGYQKLHGGLIIQWGTQTPPANGAIQTYNFPIAFPSYCLTFVASLGRGGNAAGAKNDSTGGQYISNSQYQMLQNTAGSAIKIDWIAIGY